MFFHFLSFSFMFFHVLSCSFIFFHFSFIFFYLSFIFFHFSFIFFHLSFMFLSFSFIFFHFLSFSFSLLGAQNLIFSGLNFVTISLDSSYVKNQFLGPSRVFFFHFLSFVFHVSFIFFHFLSFSFSLLGAQNLIFSGLNFVTISLDSSYVKNQFLGPSRVVPPWALFSFFSYFFSPVFLSFFLLFIFSFLIIFCSFLHFLIF